MAGSAGGFPRPFGATLIAFVTLATALIPLWSLAQVSAPDTQAAERPAEMRRWAQLTGLWAGVGLLTAAGLFGMRRWGWWLALVYYAGTVLLTAVLVASGQSRPTTGLVVFQVGLSVLVVWYLMSRDVRGLFLRR